jgi:hypothetical protein
LLTLAKRLKEGERDNGVIAYAARRLKEGEGGKESLLLTLARRLKEGKEIKSYLWIALFLRVSYILDLLLTLANRLKEGKEVKSGLLTLARRWKEEEGGKELVACAG